MIHHIDFECRLVLREDLPLLGRRVMFTTPRNYAGALGKLLLERGARVVWAPTIEIWPMPDYTELDKALRDLRSYQWIAFTSENGVEAVWDRMAALGLPVSALKDVKLAAFRADSAALDKRGLKADLIPVEMSTRGIVNELARRGIRSGRVLVPVPEVIGLKEPRIIPDFVSELRRIGLEPHRVPAYTTGPATGDISFELDQLRAGKIDVLVFTSSAEIYAMLSLLGDDRNLLEAAPIAYMGRFIKDTAQEAGLPLQITIQEYGWVSLVEAIEKHFAKKV